MPAINLWTSLSDETTSCLTQSGRDDRHSRAIYLIWRVPYCAREQFSWGSICSGALGVFEFECWAHFLYGTTTSMKSSGEIR